MIIKIVTTTTITMIIILIRIEIIIMHQNRIDGDDNKIINKDNDN